MSDDIDDKENADTGERPLVKSITRTAGRLLKKRRTEDKPPAPDMLAFASTMTILLAFFIMLASFAGAPEKRDVEKAVDSFTKALELYGLSRIVYGRSNALINMDVASKKSGAKFEKEKSEVVGRTFSNLITKEIEIEYVHKGRQTVFPTNIDFVDGEAEISPPSKAYLGNLIKLIKGRDCKVTVCSYASEDFVPSTEYPTSWQFTAERSAAVTNYLHNTGNISYKRMTAVGYGEYQPLLGEDASFNASENNRTNVIISSGEDP
ncbi:MAG: OmpA/MotB family protein [Planctomycetota bacterium]|jgi:chemotaxis protein MotB